MKRFVLLVLSFLIAIIICTIPVCAAEETPAEPFLLELSDAAGADEMQDAVPENAQKLMEQAGIEEISVNALITSPKQIFSTLLDELKKQASKPLKSLGTVLGTLLLCALIDCTGDLFVEKNLKLVFQGITVLFLTISVLLPASDCIRDCVKDITACSEFLTVFAPIYASVITTCGMPVTGNLYQVLVFSAAQVISSLVSSWLIPLSGVYLALSIAGALSPQLQLSSMLNTLKSAICWTLGVLLTGFVTLLTLQSSLTSGMDALTLKTSKILISSFVPVVGGALSEAVSTAAGYLRLLRSVFGVYGIAAAVCIFLPSLLRTGLWYLILNIGSAVGEMLSVKTASGLLKAGASLMSILIAVQFLYLLLILVSTTILLLSGTGMTA